jgi:GMP synthase (glutamine-hydrolysing)
MTKGSVLILDFGSPYTKLIAQRVRENHVFCRIVPYNIPAKEIKLQKPKGIILSGRSTRAFTKKPPLPDKAIFRLKIPILGIDYGMQVIVKALGGRLKSAKIPEFQRCELFIDETRHLFWQTPSNITCWMNSSDFIRKLPSGFKKTAHTQGNPIAAIACFSRKIYGVGFHPEVVTTQRGSQILSNFLYKICGCIGTWTMNSFIRETINNIKKTVGKAKVILNMTPTLDSFVTALLVNKAIGKKLKCVFIDNGLLCKDEKKQIKKTLSRYSRLNLSFIDRSKRFIHSLQGVTKPEEKKTIAKNLFIKVFQEEVKRLKGVEFLAQATLYPDVGKPARSLLTCESPEKPKKRRGRSKSKSGSDDLCLRLKPLQPVADLFKDEVKVVAKELGLPDNLIFRQPFPDTGLATRIIGEVTLSRLKVLREAQNCLVEEIKAAGIYEQVWQSFAILLPIRNIIAIRCVASTDGLNAEWVRLPYEILDKICRRILHKVKGVKRVVYDLSSQPPASIEWE